MFKNAESADAFSAILSTRKDIDAQGLPQLPCDAVRSIVKLSHHPIVVGELIETLGITGDLGAATVTLTVSENGQLLQLCVAVDTVKH